MSTDKQAISPRATETERERKRRRMLGLLLLLLIGTTEDRLHQAGEEFGAGTLPLSHLELTLLAILADAHAHAAYLGRTLAENLAPFGADDALFGQVQAQEQVPYLRSLIGAIQDGKYTNPEGNYRVAAILARLSLYARRVRGTANEAWARSLPSDAVIYWRLGVTERHCEDCPAWAQGGPYTPATLPAYPGDGASECLVNCLCWLETADGATGFLPEES